MKKIEQECCTLSVKNNSCQQKNYKMWAFN